MSERPKNFERSWRILEYLRANSDAEHCVTRAEMLRDPVMQHYVAGKETFNDAIFNMALAGKGPEGESQLFTVRAA